MCMAYRFFAAAVLLAITFAAAQNTSSDARPRASDLGLKVGVLPSGPLNAITDVAGVTVGHTTIVRGDNIRTGVTAVLPHSGNLYREKVPGAIYVGNGFGKLAGSTQVDEMGDIETPILLDLHHERASSGGCGDQLHVGAPRERGCAIHQPRGRRNQ